ncbi:MAG: anhydro-N-acetylmuramic acid kinase [Porticoccaceae bacterium]|nr:anhydro-N-acetylmuramic acid kinase [Porticoccaceae bacterium]
MANFYIGLMSGTSIDSVDAVVASFEQGQFKLIGRLSYDIPDHLKQAIQNLCQPGIDTVQLYAETDQQLGELFAQASLAMMAELGISSDQILAIGSHGQTVRHSAPGQGGIAFTQQIGDPNTIAARTGCPVVADFRRKDMALGGHGAPLVPAFHQQLFSDSEQNRVIVNIGGIANITVLPANGPCAGFDTGPGNLLVDSWCKKHLGKEYDNNGQWGAGGSCDTNLLKQLKSHSFFALPAPKSTGRETFHQQWLEQQLSQLPPIDAQDIQATLIQFTAETIADEINNLGLMVHELYICGGGAFNTELMNRLGAAVTATVASTAALGLDPNWVEASAFAWLAKQRLEAGTGNIAAVTGAERETVLGGLYLP